MTFPFLLNIAILIFSVVIHEVSHGYAAYYLGDPTAKYAGRLTLNPLKHLDLWGTIMFFIIGLGWAKPVPYNPYNLKDQKYGPALVGVAGPLSNIAIALFAGILMRALMVSQVTNEAVYLILNSVIWVNIALTFFNLLPIPPLDGSKLLYLLVPLSEHTKRTLETYGFIVILILMQIGGSGLFFLLIARVNELFMKSIVFVGM